MTPGTSFADLMRRLEQGDPDAAAVVYEHYARRLIGLAQRRLPARLRAKVGPDDVAQSVFRTFFRRAAQHQFDLHGADSLWALLAEITLRKCGRWSRHFATRKRGGDAQAAALADLDPGDEPADDREPSPADAALLLDLLEELLRGLDEREQLVCELRLQECSAAEIAERTGWSEATVFRKLDRIKRRLRRLCPPSSD
jgi:RNA polymerase sigma factor (sigma-70 family)